MAIFIPSLNQINTEVNLKPTEGELELLNKLDSLNDEYIVYFHPFFNTYYPDIIVMRKGYGIFIIEVCEYDLNDYKHIPQKNSKDSKFGEFKPLDLEHNQNIENPMENPIENPMEKLEYYKNILFDLYLPSFVSMKIKDVRSYGIIKNCVYFSNNYKSQIVSKISKNKHINYVLLLGNNSNVVEEINKKQKANLFTQDMFEEAANLFNQTFERKGDVITLMGRQNELSESIAEKEQKIKGVAGSGKTLILAKRALNAYKVTKDKVLILTYNITLCNYIRKKIEQLGNGNKSNFYIINYHQFLIDNIIKTNWYKSKYKNCNPVDFTGKIPKYYIDYVVPEECKFKTILIDEAQDFEYEWFDLIKSKFLVEGGEYVIFGDEKQNIYDREQEQEEDRKIVKTNIRGKWTKLLDNHRLSNDILDLSSAFQKEFMSYQYALDDNKQMTLNFSNQTSSSIIEYHQGPIDFQNLSNLIDNTISKLNLNYNNITVLSSEIAFLRNFENYIKFNKRHTCTTIFETSKELEKIIYNHTERIIEIYKVYNENDVRNKIQTIIKNNLEIITNSEITINAVNNFNINDYNIEDNSEITNDDDDNTKPKINLESPIFNIVKFIITVLDPNISVSSVDILNEYDEILKEFIYIKDSIKKIRQSKKLVFSMDTDNLKLCTVHSFKGWEVNTLILILDPDTVKSMELVYTALTRCKTNLIIVDLNDASSNNVYNKFLKEYVQRRNQQQ